MLLDSSLTLVDTGMGMPNFNSILHFVLLYLYWTIHSYMCFHILLPNPSNIRSRR